MLGLSSQPKVDCFNSFSEPIARVPRWLKEASTDMDRQAKKEGKIMMASKYNHALVKYYGEQVLVTTKTHQQLRTGCGFVEMGGCKLKNGDIMRELIKAPVRNSLPQVKHSARMTSSVNNGTECSNGRWEVVNLTKQSLFNVNLNLREVKGL